jgi:hypothetical protein
VATHSEPPGQRTAAVGARRLDQPDDGQVRLRRSTHLRSCRQAQSDAPAVGANHRDHGAAGADLRARELSAVGFRLLSALPEAARRLYPSAAQGAGMRRQVGSGDGVDRAPGRLLYPGPRTGGDRQLVWQQRTVQAPAPALGYARSAPLAPAGEPRPLGASRFHTGQGRAAAQVRHAPGQCERARCGAARPGADLHSACLWALREVVAAAQVVLLKTLRCPVWAVWFYRKTQWIGKR